MIGDDCSQDETWAIVQKYEKKYPKKIKAFRNPQNLGITGNCNEILKRCTGEYITFIAGDDLMRPEKISTQFQFMEANTNCAVSYHDMVVFESNTGKPLHKFSATAKPRQGGIATLLEFGCFNSGSATMIRRNMSPKLGFDQRVPIASDWLYWIECLANGHEIRYIDEILGDYRRHSKNITGQPGLQANFSGLQDHFVSCGIIKSQYPEYLKLVNKRESELFRSMRFYNNSCKYRFYLQASLFCRLNLKALYALIINILLNRKL